MAPGSPGGRRRTSVCACPIILVITVPALGPAALGPACPWPLHGPGLLHAAAPRLGCGLSPLHQILGSCLSLCPHALSLHCLCPHIHRDRPSKQEGWIHMASSPALEGMASSSELFPFQHQRTDSIRPQATIHLLRLSTWRRHCQPPPHYD
jgi:hypothetical protein